MSTIFEDRELLDGAPPEASQLCDDFVEQSDDFVGEGSIWRDLVHEVFHPGLSLLDGDSCVEGLPDVCPLTCLTNEEMHCGLTWISDLGTNRRAIKNGFKEKCKGLLRNRQRSAATEDEKDFWKEQYATLLKKSVSINEGSYEDALEVFKTRTADFFNIGSYSVNTGSYLVDEARVRQRRLGRAGFKASDYTIVHRPRSMPMVVKPPVEGGALQTVDLVVAHYEEHSVAWLADVERELPTVRIFVYEKGHAESLCRNLLRRATCVALPNSGREAHSYLTHIVERYDQLSDKVVFSQGGAPGYGFLEGKEGGHLMPGSDFFEDYLSPTTPPRVVFTMARQKNGAREILLKRAGYPINEPHPATFPTEPPAACGGDWSVLSNATVPFWEALHARNPSVDLPNPEAFWRAYLQDELGPMSDAYTPFANGAVLSAAGAALRERPKSFYEKLRNAAGMGNEPDAIFFIEMLFAHITGHTDEARVCSQQIQASSVAQPRGPGGEHIAAELS